LAAFQVPACRIDPIRGAAVNVSGHINIFEASKRFSEANKDSPIQNIVYASSAAVTGFATDYSKPLVEIFHFFLIKTQKRKMIHPIYQGLTTAYSNKLMKEIQEFIGKTLKLKALV